MNDQNYMKTITTILAAVLLFAGLHSKALAQSDASTTTASANVVQSLEVGAESQNLDFGNMLAGTTKQVSASNGLVVLGTGGGITGGEQRGYISIETAGGTSLDLSLTVPSSLQDGSNNTLSLDFDTSRGGTTQSNLFTRISEVKPTGTDALDNYNDGFILFNYNGGTWSLDNPPIIMPASGTVYMALGGEVFADENQPAGNYSGDVTLTATITD